ncbi:MAG: hypothetical protein ABEJ24_00210 [Candidatus Magasanikbacteria bacterium]
MIRIWFLKIFSDLSVKNIKKLTFSKGAEYLPGRSLILSDQRGSEGVRIRARIVFQQSEVIIIDKTTKFIDNTEDVANQVQ